ncbi:TetR/AcrR family transcriptional regulator [Planotetraspora phitsanulokensis]|uniref:TetR family transcriptional regulator n=1 Tax=Planotetraspora phitsanulokensis TaxID=575192 RepID=A0A8J3U8I9_9ACTN|nr:TetR/AcrR family transcriptional regulator [Planotetraspora phitsanulokensis]GII40674.1 TetR family transcriptional regulator [Planotetraspora phitsanulokensis]
MTGAARPAPAEPGGRRGETRQKIYRAAVELIAEQGFTATTVDAIADRAGVAKGTVFYNFGSKEGLFAELLGHGVQRLADTLAEAARPETARFEATRSEATRPETTRAEPARAGRAGALEALDAVVLAQLRFFDEYGPFARVLVAEMWREAWQEVVIRLRAGALGVYQGVLDDAVAAGELRSGLDTGTAATAIFGMVLTVAIERRALHPESPLEDVHATLTELIHGRISGPGTAPPNG